MSSFAQAGNEAVYNQMLGMLPANHDEALEVALRLVRYVYHQKARSSETQYERMMHLNTQKNEDRMRRLLEENATLVRERDGLVTKTQSMTSELAKLDAVRKNLGIAMNQPAPPRTSTGAPYMTVNSSYAGLNLSNASPHRSNFTTDYGGGGGGGGLNMNNSLRVNDLKGAGATAISSPVSRHSDVISAIDRSVQQTASRQQYTSPSNNNKKNLFNNSNSNGNIFAGSKSSGITNSSIRSPLPKNSPSLVTGKAFFRECRLRLKPPVFDAFLEVVKQLNRNEMSREQAVEKSKEVLGTDNMELVGSFRTLLFG